MEVSMTVQTGSSMEEDPHILANFYKYGLDEVDDVSLGGESVW